MDGTLVFPPRGTAGFGYDPIFLADGHDRTFGEMSSQEKHGIPADGSLALSHRARAFQKLQRARGSRAAGVEGAPGLSFASRVPPGPPPSFPAGSLAGRWQFWRRSSLFKGLGAKTCHKVTASACSSTAP